MRHAFTILRYTLLRNVRDVPSTIEMVLMPIGIVFVLGSVLGTAFEPADISPTPVTFVIEADGEYADGFSQFLGHEEIAHYLAVTESSTREEAHRLLETGEAVAAITLARDDHGEGATITITEGAGSTLRLGIVRSVVDSFVRGVNVTGALGRLGHSGATYEPLPAEFQASAVSREGRVPGAFDFYAVSMLVLFVMYIAQYSAEGLREDVLEPLGARARTTPAAWWTQISGKLAAHVASGVVQAAIIVTVTALVFGVNWGTQPLLLTGLVLSLCVFAAAFGGLVLAITRDGPKSQSVISAVIVGSMFLSGGAFRIGNVSASFRAFQQLLPHYQGQRAILAMIYGAEPGAIGAAFSYFLGGAALLFALTAILTRRSS